MVHTGGVLEEGAAGRLTDVSSVRVRRRVLSAAGFLVVAQLLVRGWLFVGRDFYGDDFRLLHLADHSQIWSPSYLLHDFHGQMMPGALFLVGLVERIAPLEWWPAAVMLIVFQAAASLLLWRLLRTILGDRPAMLVPLVFGLFTPLTLGSSSWWAAALNSLPLQIGLAWYLADALRLSETGRFRYACSGTVALAFSLAFYLKAVLVPVAAVGFVVIVMISKGESSPIAAAWRRARSLWLGSGAVGALWGVTYLLTKDTSPVGGGDLDDVFQTVETGFRAMAPSIFGGPFQWSVTPGAAPLAELQAWAVYAGGLVLGLTFAWTVARLRGAVLVWGLVAVIAGIGLFMAGVGRSGLGLGGLLPLAYRYFAGEAVLLPAAAALLLCLPRRDSPDSNSRDAPRHKQFQALRPALVVAATVLFVFNAVQSTISHHEAWQDDRAGEYLANVRDSLESAGSVPLLDQAVPDDIMWPLARPDNLISRMFSSLPDRPPIESWTTDLQVLDHDGHLQPAEVVPTAQITDGVPAQCGQPPGHSEAALPLTASLDYARWTLELRYQSETEGTIEVALDPAEPVSVPIQEGAHSVYVRLIGGGDILHVTPSGADPGFCIEVGLLGDTTVR